MRLRSTTWWPFGSDLGLLAGPLATNEVAWQKTKDGIAFCSGLSVYRKLMSKSAEGSTSVSRGATARELRKDASIASGMPQCFMFCVVRCVTCVSLGGVACAFLDF